MMLVVGKGGRVIRLSKKEAMNWINAGKVCGLIPDGAGGFARICKKGGKKFKPKGFKKG